LTLKSLKSFVAERARERDQRRQIHVAGVCDAEDLRRVEEAETSLAAMRAGFLPVVGVITKACADQGSGPRFRISCLRQGTSTACVPSLSSSTTAIHC
jgi:hypothetical protein